MATRSSVLAWKIPGTAEAGRLQSMGSHRVRHNWSDLAVAAAAGQKLSLKGRVIIWRWCRVLLPHPKVPRFQCEGLPKAHTASLSASDLSGTVGSIASCGPSAELLAQQPTKTRERFKPFLWKIIQIRGFVYCKPICSIWLMQVLNNIRI